VSSQTSNISAILKFIHFNLKYLGFVHFSIDDLRNTRPTRFKRITFVHLAHAIYATLAIIYFPQYFSMFIRDSLISKLVCSFPGLFTVLSGLDSILWSKLYHKQIYKLFEVFYQLNRSFEKANINLNYKKVKINGATTLTVEVLQSLSTVILHTIFDWREQNNSLVNRLMIILLFFYIFWGQATFPCQHVLFSNSARLMFLQIDKELNMNISNERIRLCCQLHGKICDSVKLINKLYTIQILVNFMSNFILITLAIYGNIVTAFDMPAITLITSFGNWVMIYKIWILIVIAEQLKSSVSVKLCSSKIKNNVCHFWQIR
jgi:hypothetical protein